MLAQIRKARQEEKGFTLIELLIVIVILGVLAGIVVFSVTGITDTGAAAACKADHKATQVASEAFRAKNGSYAADVDALKTGGFLRTTHVAGENGYTITYNAVGGTVAASGACTIAAS